MSRRRTLRPDEAELWHAVVRNAHPLHPGKPPGVPQHQHAPAAPDVENSRPAVDAFRIGERVHPKHGQNFTLPVVDALRTVPLQMDAKAFGKMTRGKLLPEARIDLHGMTLAEAHPELIRFVLNAATHGLRLVLVITGKGRRGEDVGPIPRRMGVLRHQVPMWLQQPPLGSSILQITEAHLRHGGSGAYYVYLRRH